MSYDEILKLAAERQKGGGGVGGGSGKPGPSPSVANQRDDAYRTNKITTSFNKKHKDKPVTIGNGHLKEAAEKYKAKPKNTKTESSQQSSSKPKSSQGQNPVLGNGRTINKAVEKYRQKFSKGESGQSSDAQRSQGQKPAVGNGRIKEAAEKYKPKSSKPTASSATKERPHQTQKPIASSARERSSQTQKPKVTSQSRITDYTTKGGSKEPKPSRNELPGSKKPNQVVGKKCVVPSDKDRRRLVQSGDRERPHSSQMGRDRGRDAEFRRPVSKKRPGL